MPKTIKRIVLTACLCGLLFLLGAAGCVAPQSFTFYVTADNRNFTPPEHPGSAYFTGVCEAIRDLGSGAFIISPGDIDPPDRTYATIQQVLGQSYTWYPVVGNHEFGKPEYMEWLRNYNVGGCRLPNIVRGGPPGAVESCYSFNYGNAYFVVLNLYYDGERDNAGTPMVNDALYQWLADGLAANRKPIIFVAGHEPAVPLWDMDTGRWRHVGSSLDRDPATDYRFWSLLGKHHVTAYLCGHTHNSSVAKINGVWQLDAGHARGLGDTGAPSTFLQIRVTGEQVDCDVFRSADAGKQPYRNAYSERLR